MGVHTYTPGYVIAAAASGGLTEFKQAVAKVVQAQTLSEREALSCSSATLRAQPLHAAAEQGNIEVVQEILRAGIFVSPVDVNAVTPLQLAALRGHTAVVTALLEAGADVFTNDALGDTPLHWAAQGGNQQVVNALIGAGSNVNALNERGWTPLHRAAIKNRAAAATSLLSHGADASAACSAGRTPLHEACRFSSLDVAHVLCARGAPVDALDGDGLVCWELGPRHGEAAKGLLEEVLGRELRPSNAALARAAASVVNMSTPSERSDMTLDEPVLLNKDTAESSLTVAEDETLHMSRAYLPEVHLQSVAAGKLTSEQLSSMMPTKPSGDQRTASRGNRRFLDKYGLGHAKLFAP